jgi:hypothetical protein
MRNHRWPARLGWKSITLICLLIALLASICIDHLRRPGPIHGQPIQHAHMLTSMTSGAGAPSQEGGIAVPSLSARFESGSLAPDFSLPGIASSKVISLTSFRGKPIVLAFGSLTCDVFCKHTGALDRLHETYKDRSAFLFVNIREAGHEIAGLEFLLEAPDSSTESSIEKRRTLIARAVNYVKMTMPGVIDIHGKAERDYRAYPLRLIVVDAEGRIALDLGVGIDPQHPWDLGAVETWLKAH